MPTEQHLEDPLTHSQAKTTFRIEASGPNRWLRSDVYLIVAPTTTDPNISLDAYAGGYALINSITIKSRRTGAEIYELLDANAYGRLQLMKRSPGQAQGVDYQLAKSRRAFQTTVATGLITQLPIYKHLAATEATTCQFTIDLRRIVKIFSSLWPLEASGTLVIDIQWAGVLAATGGAAAGFNIPPPKLSYTLINSAELDAAFAAGKVPAIPGVWPRRVSNDISVGSTHDVIGMGGGGRRVFSFVGAFSAGGTLALAVPDDDQHNAEVNKGDLYTESLGPNSCQQELQYVLGQHYACPPSGWYQTGGDPVVGAGVPEATHYIGMSLKKDVTQPGSMTNSTLLDRRGLSWRIDRAAAGPALRAFGWFEEAVEFARAPDGSMVVVQ